jgi:glutathione S-transferase
MLLYHDPRAPNPRRVRIFLAEKGVSYETIEVKIADNAHRQPGYLAKNPLGLLPVLELADGRILRESVAICRYIEDQYPDPNLFGTDPWERVTIEQWNRHAELEVLFPVSQVFRNTHQFWSGRIKQAPEFGDIMRELLSDRLAWFDTELSRRRFVAGDRFTIADITLLCALDFGKVSNIRLDPAAHPNLVKWHATVSARPSTKA